MVKLSAICQNCQNLDIVKIACPSCPSAGAENEQERADLQDHHQHGVYAITGSTYLPSTEVELKHEVIYSLMTLQSQTLAFLFYTSSSSGMFL